jgi:phosphopentomutase
VSARAFVVVLDACGVGALPDAAAYGDAGADTLGHLAERVGGLDLPVLASLGLGCVAPIAGVAPAAEPAALHGRLHALGPGKDSTVGHWELMGAPAPAPLRTYPGGFPEDIVTRIEAATGRRVICNAPYNGIDAIRDHGAEQVSSGALIVYTSQDSVLQIAAHEDVVAREELYAACASAREIMAGEHAVGRVIARPFAGVPGEFRRTEGRRDLALAPGPTYLDLLQKAGVTVHSVGKVAQLFAGRGFDVEHAAASNPPAIAAITRLIDELDDGFVFANLVDTDQVHGHRHDVDGFAAALRAIDAAVGEWLERLRPDDLLILTADHGCDPTASHTDHTREYVPLLACDGGGRTPPVAGPHDGPMADVGASVLHWLTRAGAELPGKAFAA